MKSLIVNSILALCISLNTYSQDLGGIDTPIDFGNKKILVYLNDISETTLALNNEYERITSPENVKSRKERVLTLIPGHVRLAIGDSLAICVKPTILDWFNKAIEKSALKADKEKFLFATSASITDFPTDSFKYILKYNYVMHSPDPPDVEIYFYVEDRTLIEIDSTEIIQSKSKNFRPFYYYGHKKIDPFYGTIKAGKVKSELQQFFETF